MSPEKQGKCTRSGFAGLCPEIKRSRRSLCERLVLCRLSTTFSRCWCCFLLRGQRGEGQSSQKKAGWVAGAHGGKCLAMNVNYGGQAPRLAGRQDNRPTRPTREKAELPNTAEVGSASKNQNKFRDTLDKQARKQIRRDSSTTQFRLPRRCIRPASARLLQGLPETFGK